MGVPAVQIRVMSAIDGVSWDEVWASPETGVFGSRVPAFIGRDCYSKNKCAAGRPKDLADIDALGEGDVPGPSQDPQWGHRGDAVRI